MIVGFTGTRGGMTPAQYRAVDEVLRSLGAEIFVHGCAMGADAEASGIAHLMGCDVIGWPAKGHGVHGAYTKLHAKLPPLVRNRHIVDRCTVLVACPRTAAEQRRSGTWATIRYARKVQRILVLINPDGSKEYEGEWP